MRKVAALLVSTGALVLIGTLSLFVGGVAAQDLQATTPTPPTVQSICGNDVSPCPQTPTPTADPQLPPPTPTVSPRPTIPSISPPPIHTPTVPPPPPTPTVPPVRTPTPPPSITTLPKLTANPQFAKAFIYNTQGVTLALNNDGGQFQKVALQAGQAVTVVMTLTATDIGQPADLEVVDGGAISSSVAVPKATVPPTATPYPTPPIEVDPQTAPLPSPSTPPNPCGDAVTDCISGVNSPDPKTLIDTGATVPVSTTGQLVFSFRPGDGPGLHRVSVFVNGNQYIFQFWQQDPAHLNSNPNLVRAY